MSLSGAATPGQSGHGSNGNEGVLRIPHNFSTAGTSLSDCLVLYPGHLLAGGSYPSLQRCRQSQCILQPQPTGKFIYRIDLVENYFNLCVTSP